MDATTLTGGKHGTKFLGAILVASSVAAQIDPTMVPPSWLPYIGTIVGLGTLVRGFVNSAAQK